jgi:hypothetical protein
MDLIEKYKKGNGNRFVLVITYDESEDFSKALQNAIDDIGLGKEKTAEASDTYAYGFEIEKKMKKYKVTASSITYYEIEIEAENEDQAYEIGHLTDGAMFKEVPNSSDWCIYKTEEVTP